ncbi:hypothetical protein F4819DRAFT_446070 [Hypoxylon fuscum]|nr:hypothetical protein F4819DRAFT_446070 [Hypoxylon fuscum]
MNTLGLSFLFVVNEIQLAEDYSTNQDEFGNVVPHGIKSAYGPEKVGTVYRFHNGNISLATGFVWKRPGMGHEGRINKEIVHDNRQLCIVPSLRFLTNTETIQPTFIPCFHYKTTSVFSRGPTLSPLSVELDVTTRDLETSHLPKTKLQSLSFRSDDCQVSRIARGGKNKRAVGKDASWIGTLVPSMYENLDEDAQHSKGLGGDLGVIIGLMALAEPPGHIDDAFLHHWDDYRWTGQRQSERKSH